MVRQLPPPSKLGDTTIFVSASSNILGEMLLSQGFWLKMTLAWLGLSNISPKMLLEALIKIAVSPSLEAVVEAAAPFTN